ncbi:MAG: hypothetical protein ACRYFB_14285 [Janthinobacterium lividum]
MKKVPIKIKISATTAGRKKMLHIGSSGLGQLNQTSNVRRYETTREASRMRSILRRGKLFRKKIHCSIRPIHTVDTPISSKSSSIWK